MTKTKVYSFSDPESPICHNQAGQLCRRETRTVIHLDTNEPASTEQCVMPIFPIRSECVAPIPAPIQYVPKKVVAEGEWVAEANGPLLKFSKQFSPSMNALLAEIKLNRSRVYDHYHKAPANDWVQPLCNYFAQYLLQLPKEQIQEMSLSMGCNTNAKQDAIRCIHELLTFLLKCSLMPRPLLNDAEIRQYYDRVKRLYSDAAIQKNTTGCFFAQYSGLTTLDAEMLGELLDHPDVRTDPVACMLAEILFLLEGVSAHPEWLEISATEIIKLLEEVKRKRNAEASEFVVAFLLENVPTCKKSEIAPFLPTPEMYHVLAICAAHPEGVSSSRLQESLGESSKSIFQKTVLEPLHQEKLLELSIKDKKSSPLQKNMLTKLGRAVLEKNGSVPVEHQPCKDVSAAESTVPEADSNRTK